MRAGLARTLPPRVQPRGKGATAATSFLRRQLALAVVAGVVVLVAVVVVGAVMAGGSGDAHAALRPAADGSVVTVSPLAQSTRSAVWVAVAALVAIAAVLALAMVHAWRVARFTVLSRSGGPTFTDEAVPPDAVEEAC